MADSRQWKRVAQVVIGKGGSGLLVESLRVQFEVVKTIDAAPNTALIRIFNLSPTNEARIKNEFDEVLLNCGYQDAVRLVFRGNIKHVYRYRDGNDYITEIEAADGDRAYRTAIVNETLAAGTTNRQLIDRLVGTMPGANATPYVGIPDKGRIRGKVITGNTRDALGEIARDADANWSIQDGRLVIVPAQGLMDGEAVVIRADTGMLGAPEVNDKGITVKCLLNPQLRINGAVQLDNNDIKRKKEKVGAVEGTGQRVVEDPAQLPTGPIRLDPDGLYKLIKVTHKGDTRANDWFSESVCIALDSRKVQAATKPKTKKPTIVG